MSGQQRPTNDLRALLQHAADALQDAIEIWRDPCGDLKLARLRERDAKRLLAWADEVR